MLDTNKFVESLVDSGYKNLCVVPCSFAKDVINSAINNKNIEYIPCASEAVACSIAAGIKMAGGKVVVIVQSSGVTNMGSCITSLLKPYNVSFPIITSWRTYKDGDSEIQHQHLATELPQLINAYGYKHLILNQESISQAISQLEICDTSDTIAVLKKDTFSKVELSDVHKIDLSKYPKRSKYLEIINKIFEDDKTLFIGTTGNTAREMYSFMPKTNNFYMAGNMGGALSIGLGAAKEGKKVVVCGGDAEFAMHMGGLATAGRYNDKIHLTYLLFDNEANKSTGGQNTYQKHIDYISIAKSTNFEVAEKTITNLEEFEKQINSIKNNSRLKFLHIKCDFDPETPRPPLEVVKVNSF
jgi:phosphonopyruvate decarboxylase